LRFQVRARFVPNAHQFHSAKRVTTNELEWTRICFEGKICSTMKTFVQPATCAGRCQLFLVCADGA